MSSSFRQPRAKHPNDTGLLTIRGCLNCHARTLAWRQCGSKTATFSICHTFNADSAQEVGGNCARPGGAGPLIGSLECSPVPSTVYSNASLDWATGLTDEFNWSLSDIPIYANKSLICLHIMSFRTKTMKPCFFACFAITISQLEKFAFYSDSINIHWYLHPYVLKLWCLVN